MTAQYRFGIHRVEGNVARLKCKETGGRTGRFGSYENHYSIAIDTRWKPQWRTAASYAGNAGVGEPQFAGFRMEVEAEEGRDERKKNTVVATVPIH